MNISHVIKFCSPTIYFPTQVDKFDNNILWIGMLIQLSHPTAPVMEGCIVTVNVDTMNSAGVQGACQICSVISEAHRVVLASNHL